MTRGWGAVWVLLALGAPRPIVGQAGGGEGGRIVRQLSLPLIDIGFATDTLDGHFLVAALAIGTKQARDSARAVWLSLHPDSTMDWLNGAALVLHGQPLATERDGVRWSPVLHPARGVGLVAVGRSIRKGKLQNRAWLQVADSSYNWEVEITPTAAETFLNRLFESAAGSRFVPVADRDPSQSCASDVTHVGVTRSASVRWRGSYGRVIATWVVDTTGAPIMETFDALLASDPVLVEETRRAIAGERFRPALCDGRLISHVVQQIVIWSPR